MLFLCVKKYEFTFNDEGKFIQLQMDITFDFLLQQTTNKWKIIVLAETSGMKYINTEKDVLY